MTFAGQDGARLGGEVFHAKTAFKDKLFTSTQQWLHIELRFCEHIAESTLSYADFKRLKRWRLEHISLAADPQQSVLAE